MMDNVINDIQKNYRQLQGIRKRPDHDWRFWLSGRSASDEHAAHYDALQQVCAANPGAVADLLFSGVLDDSEALEVMNFGGHGGSASKEDNRALWELNIILRARQNELPPSVQHHLDWLLRVHGY